MDATLIVIDSDAELSRARALVDRLWGSDDAADMARLQAQARLIAAYEESKWPRRPPSTAELIRHLMDQHGLTRADMVQIRGPPSRVSEVLGGKKELSMTMVQRLRARFRVPADLLIPPPKQARRTTKRAAAWRAPALVSGVYSRPDNRRISARRKRSSVRRTSSGERWLDSSSRIALPIPPHGAPDSTFASLRMLIAPDASQRYS